MCPIAATEEGYPRESTLPCVRVNFRVVHIITSVAQFSPLDPFGAIIIERDEKTHGSGQANATVEDPIPNEQLIARARTGVVVVGLVE